MRVAYSSTTIMAFLGIASAFHLNSAGRYILRTGRRASSSDIRYKFTGGFFPSVNTKTITTNNVAFVTRGGMQTQRMMSTSPDAPFTTWTFDKACDTMEFTDFLSASVSITSDASSLDDSDLVILGVYGPEETEDENEDNESKEEEAVAPALEGKLKELDEELDGALTEIMMENSKEFKNGSALGATTPTIRANVSTQSKQE